jgi:hypothetical protein
VNSRTFQVAVRELSTVLDDALEMLHEFTSDVERNGPEQRVPPASLLEQCIALCRDHHAAAPEPVRTVHHFACTGGTLISKCIAAMPNTQLLSEVDPFSTLQDRPGNPRFAPTDMVQLIRQSTRGSSHRLLAELFLNGLDVVHGESVRLGQRLVLRDHAHSHYCVGPDVADRPSLRWLVASRHPVLSVLTVRHPIDSYVSLLSNDWLHFYPSTFDEYCCRYLAFLRAHEDLPSVKYESFVDHPHQTMQRVCSDLDIPFSEDFIHLFGVFALSGDSGRTSDQIQKRARRPLNAAFAEEIRQSPHYRLLHETLEYSRDV